jgi:hypothetical protein
MSFKITGLDEFAKRLTDVAKALEGLGGDLCTVKFDPNDPFSLEAAVVQMEQTIDAKHPIVETKSWKVSSGKRRTNSGKTYTTAPPRHERKT